MTDDPLARPLVAALAIEVAKARTHKIGGKGHWTQWEEQHPEEAYILPVTYHLPGCEASPANHWRMGQGCSAHCKQHALLLAEAAALLRCDVADFYPRKEKRRGRED